MRNELFGRLLYLTVNTCFAKVCKKSSGLSLACWGTHPLSPHLRHRSFISGPRCGFGSVVHLFYNTLEESTLDAPSLALVGWFSK